MSGGYIDKQKNLGHQVVIFTFTGDIDNALVTQWNAAVKDLKEEFGAKLTGVTMKGERTRPAHLKKWKNGKKRKRS